MVMWRRTLRAKHTVKGETAAVRDTGRISERFIYMIARTCIHKMDVVGCGEEGWGGKRFAKTIASHHCAARRRVSTPLPSEHVRARPPRRPIRTLIKAVS